MHFLVRSSDSWQCKKDNKIDVISSSSENLNLRRFPGHGHDGTGETQLGSVQHQICSTAVIKVIPSQGKEAWRHHFVSSLVFSAQWFAIDVSPWKFQAISINPMDPKAVKILHLHHTPSSEAIATEHGPSKSVIFRARNLHSKNWDFPASQSDYQRLGKFCIFPFS